MSLTNNSFDPLQKLQLNPAYCKNYAVAENKMKLDMDFVREILLAIEDKKNLKYAELKFNNRSDDEIRKHLKVLINAGLLDSKTHGSAFYVSDLTWEGHEYLEKIRNPETWSKTKAALKKTGEWGLKTTMDIATAIIKAKIDTLIHTGKFED